MRQFVTDQEDRATTSRARNAQELKVAVPPTQLANSSRAPAPQPQLQQEDHGTSMPPPQSRNGQTEPDPFMNAPIEHNDETQHSMFGTDTENFDDSTASQSQFTEDQAHAVAQEEVQASDEGDMDDEHEDNDQQVLQQHPGEVNMQATERLLAQRAGHPSAWPNRQVLGASAKSYPTTTSGRLDEGDYGGPAVDEEEEGLKSSSHRLRLQIPARYQPLQPPHSEWSVQDTGTQQQANDKFSSLYQRGAVDREQTKSVPNGAKQRCELRPASARPYSAMSAQTQKAAPRAQRNFHVEPPTQTPPIAKQAAIKLSRQGLVVPVPAAKVAPIPNLSAQQLAGHEEPDEDEDDDADDNPDSMVPVDYSESQLRDMPYATLENEPFDHDPHAEPLVLPAAQANLPLHERLTAVQRDPDPAAKAKFFASLNLEDWEEAGDWFLDQFGSIVKKMKEARQKKRKIAREFEDEVRKRDAQVASKRRCVEQAMLQMRNQGAGLLQGTPKKRGASASR
ncbi:hypothetical protein K490DRAFT_61038 [Saccharata proteae CBS 121410]|uniref:Extracellular mutant protein 11 C-terminal domain-containing protein n=1 Tax=Saccharata proteae CBS 121410 TaxID=1314787 RepID=A0A9P4I2P2_9PEZI|nr:hypothetical protein K490DRAFT_61038 [Saccharata proteae CBS 121410]